MKPRIGHLIAILSALAVVPGRASAQKPVVNPGGIVNAATFAPKGQPGYAVDPGALASVFGQNLASGTASAQSFPLPTTLAGTTVTFGGVPAPLIYVSPTQINLQVPAKAPFDSIPTGTGFTRYVYQVVVTTSAGASEPQAAEGAISPGIFTLDASGCGRGAVLNVAQDGAVSLNGPEHSAEPGGFLALWGTGLASYADPDLPDGLPAPANPPARYFATLSSILNEKYVGSDHTMFAGAAPGFAGLDQINLRLPADAPEGCSIPLQFVVVDSNKRSQSIPVSIRRGGGQCVDAPQSLAFFLWTRTVATGIDPPPPADTLSIEFSSGVGKKAPAFPPRLRPGEYATNFSTFAGEPYAGWVFPPGPACPTFSEDRQLDAGILTAEAPGLSLRIAPATVNSQPRYSATLPAGTIQPGLYRITGEGGADVGPFTTTLNVPEPIRHVTVGPPIHGPEWWDPYYIPVVWEGGDPNSMVTVKVFFSYGFYQNTGFASSGRIEVAARPGYQGITVIQMSPPIKMERFQAGGLTLGGWHVWSYEFRFWQ